MVSCTISGGGSRASFQVGALQYLYRHDPLFQPTVFVGASAGSILAAGLAQFAAREEQAQWLDDFARIWLTMPEPNAMFQPRPWYQKLLDEAPGWLEIVQPSPPPAQKPPSRLALPSFLGRRSPTTPASPPSPLDPVQAALSPDQELRSQWSLDHLSAIASHLGRLPRLGSDVSAIWSGLERTQSMYRPGPVLRRLLEPQFFDPARVAASGNRLRVAMVALESGALRYMTERGLLVDRANQPFDDEGHDLTLGLLASCSIPGVFRAVPIADETYVDGGTRENLPAELAIGLMGSSRNYILSSQSDGVARRANMADASLFEVVMRSTDILIDEAGRDELEYAISAGAITVYPEVSVHDSMVVEPALLRINADHGWMRTAETLLRLDRAVSRRHRRVIEQRMACLRREKAWQEEPESNELKAEITVAKQHLRTLLASCHPDALPDGATDWWRRFELEVDVDPWWC